MIEKSGSHYNNFYDNRFADAINDRNLKDAPTREDEFHVFKGKAHVLHPGTEKYDFIKIFKYNGEYYDAHYDDKKKETFIRFFKYNGKNYNVYYNNNEKLKGFYILLKINFTILPDYNISLKRYINIKETNADGIEEWKKYEVKYENEKLCIEKETENSTPVVGQLFKKTEKIPIEKEDEKRIYTQNSYILDEREYPVLYDEQKRPYIPSAILKLYTPHDIDQDEKVRIRKYILSGKEEKQIKKIKTKKEN